MRITITGRNMEVTDGLRDSIEKKLEKLSKYFADDTEVRVTLSTRKEDQRIEVTIPTKVGLVRAEKESKDMYQSIDAVEEVIEKQIKKYKNKLIDKKHNTVSFSQSFIEEPAEIDYTDEDEIVIAKVKKFEVRPMDPEEACLQMEMSGHDFFVFLNSETNLISVVYKRNGKTYGMIEPEV